MTIKPTTPKMNITKNPHTHEQSLGRVITFWVTILMSGVFACIAYKGRVTAEMFLTFPLGITALYASSKFERWLTIWRGTPGEY